MNPTTTLPLSVEAIALDSVVTRLETLERERRAADAAHIAARKLKLPTAASEQNSPAPCD